MRAVCVCVWESMWHGLCNTLQHLAPPPLHSTLQNPWWPCAWLDSFKRMPRPPSAIKVWLTVQRQKEQRAAARSSGSSWETIRSQMRCWVVFIIRSLWKRLMNKHQRSLNVNRFEFIHVCSLFSAIHAVLEKPTADVVALSNDALRLSVTEGVHRTLRRWKDEGILRLWVLVSALGVTCALKQAFWGELWKPTGSEKECESPLDGDGVPLLLAKKPSLQWS